MEFKVKKYDRNSATPRWVEFICSAEHEQYISEKRRKGRIKISFKNNRYVAKVSYTQVDRRSNIMEITITLIKRIYEV